MPLSVRMYQDDNDYWRIRVFLREVFLLNNRQELSWQVARLDYWRYFGNTHLEHYALDEAICLWETADGRIGAVITPEGRGNVYLHVHPALRSPALEEAMVQAAEMHLAECSDDGRKYVTVWAHQQDGLRQQILAQGGYVRGDVQAILSGSVSAG